MDKRLFILAILFLSLKTYSQNLEQKISALPVFNELASTKTPFDWIITPEKSKAGVYASPDRKSIIITNAMVWRTLRVLPNLATTDYVNRMTGERMLRFVEGEGSICKKLLHRRTARTARTRLSIGGLD